MHTPTATSPRFVPETRDGRLLLSLTLPADCPTLDDVILSDPGALPLPDAVIRLDVARLAQAINLLREHGDTLRYLGIAAEVKSEGFEGYLTRPYVHLSVFLDYIALDLLFQDGRSETSAQYYFHIGACFAVPERDVPGYLAGLLRQNGDGA
ncbi:hypothetical protein [Cardiobacterium valvarum]|uniref:Uncharacterized protein n=1 Tax=Cardiobacterium valvarum F0432 TaxID=797473 RepID=G9ZG65_9GAMM|nr:hypothetical protein [Cardiobacterium valvarum]EHM53380.1 hypothetical protein HMPREF9080_01738 [Cardiobacterium valvarum F0432]